MSSEYQLVLYEQFVFEYFLPFVSLPLYPFWLPCVSLNVTKSTSLRLVQNVPIDCVSGEIRSYASALRFAILSFVSGWCQDGSWDTCGTILMTRWCNIHSAGECITVPGSTQLLGKAKVNTPLFAPALKSAMLGFIIMKQCKKHTLSKYFQKNSDNKVVECTAGEFLWR